MGELRAPDLIEAATAGLDVTTSPGNMEDGFAPVLRNLLVHRTGQLPMRGPITDTSALTYNGDDKIPAGAWVFNDKVLLSFMSKSGTAKREPQVAPYRKAAASTDLARGETNMRLLDLAAGTQSTVASAASSADIIGGRGARVGAYVYGLAYDVATGTNPAVNEQGGYLHRRRFLRWDGTTTAPTVYANAPEGGQDVIAHLNRVWVLGGRDVPSGAPGLIEFNSLYYSDLFGPTSDTTAMWQETSNTNKIIVDSDNPNDFGVGLALQDQNLIIFKRRSVHVLYGYSPSTFQLRALSYDVGCVDRRTIVQDEGVVYWMSDVGLHSYDGETISSHDLHAPIEAGLVPALAQTVADAGVDGGRAVGTRVSDEYILYSICKQNTTTGAQASDSSRFCVLVHTPTGRYVEFSTDAMRTPTPLEAGRTTNFTWLGDSSQIANASHLATPEAASEDDRGFDHVGATTPARSNMNSNPKVGTDTTGYTLTPPTSQKENDGGAAPPEDPIAKDTFATTSGGEDLNGRTAEIGGSWTESGTAGGGKWEAPSTPDGTMRLKNVGAEDVLRTAILNPAADDSTKSGVRARVGVVKALIGTGGVPAVVARVGVITRYVDASNYLFAWADLDVTPTNSDTSWRYEVFKMVAGTPTLLFAGSTVSSPPPGVPDLRYFELRAEGTEWEFYVNGTSKASGTDAVLGTTLASGGYGVIGEYQSQCASQSAGDIELQFEEIHAWDPEDPVRKDLTDDGTTDNEANGITATAGIKVAGGASETYGYSVTSGQTYMTSVYVRAKNASVSAELDASNVSGVGTDKVSQTISPADGWVRLNVGATASGTATRNVVVRNNNAVDSTGYLYVTQHLMETGTTLYPYIEGSVGSTSGLDARIPAAWHTRLLVGPHPRDVFHLHRWFLDYAFVVDGEAADNLSDGWFVSIVGGDGRVLLEETQVPAQGDPGGYLYRRSHVADIFGETNDLQVRIEWHDDGSGTFPAIKKAELYRVGLEYQDGRQRRSS